MTSPQDRQPTPTVDEIMEKWPHSADFEERERDLEALARTLQEQLTAERERNRELEGELISAKEFLAQETFGRVEFMNRAERLERALPTILYVVKESQKALADYVVPGGIPARQAISILLGLLDDQKLLKALQSLDVKGGG
jgi:isocitrate dehydrogenase kinase/phosphatase